VASGAGFASVSQSVLATVQCTLLSIHSLPKALSDVSIPLICRPRRHVVCRCAGSGRGLKLGLGTSDAASALRI